MNFTDSEDFDIRFTRPNDMPFLQQWLKTEGMLHWYPPEDDVELENFIRIWIGFCRYHASLTAIFKEEPVGMGVLYLMPYRKVAHQAMFQLIVSPEYQKKGVGYSLIRNLKHLAQDQFHLESLQVEVFDRSPILSLLGKLGFIEFARQEKYIKEGGNYFPRILLECELS